MSRTPPQYPASTLAKLFKLNERRIRQLASEGVIPKTERGQYDLIGAVRGYVNYLQAQASSQGVTTVEIQGQRLRRVKAQANEKELDLAQRRGDQIHINDINATGARCVIATKTGFLAMPDRLQQMLSLTDDQREEMERLIRHMLIEQSGYSDETGASMAQESTL